MAEAPPNGLFWFAAEEAARRAELDGDRVVIDVAPHGPAGVSSVDLPGGDVLQVDHLDPTRLVGVESDLIDPGGSPLLVALFGGDGALRIADRDQPTDLPGTDDAYEEPRTGGRTRGRAMQLDQDAQRAGRLVVLTDLAGDPAADPLARVVAASELIGGLDTTPGGDLFVPVVPHMVDLAVAAASQVDDDMLVALNRKLGFQIAAALRPLVAAAPTGRVRSLLFQLVERIDQLAGSGERDLRVAASMAPFEPDYDELSFFEDLPEDEMGSPTFADAARDRVSAPAIRIVRRSPSVLEVTAPRSDQPRWVRTLRTDGLVAVALAPLHRDGLMESAELLVPPDTETDDLGLQLVAADELHQLAGAPADLVRRAVRAGRAAASAERLGDRFEAMQRWERCSALWRRVGDDRRARQAMDRGTSRGGRVMVGPILADELDPYGVDAHLERADDW
jgi:hypothetical protein